ncbi:unnamed protein product [Ectocarpus sp. 6 AP-2014]
MVVTMKTSNRWLGLLGITAILSSASVFADCIIEHLGDGDCDSVNNSAECGYDLGDCCSCTCEDAAFTCGGSADFACIDPEAPCVDDDDLTADRVENCYLPSIGDSVCDTRNNIAVCAYDGGDCCECTCVPNGNSANCVGGFQCVDPAALCVNDDDITVDLVENCGGDVGIIGDGFCDEENNIAECNYDGGDCCECTCVGQTTDDYLGCNAEFSCVDPSAPCGPGPVDEPTTGFSCSGDAGIQQGDICCEASCGTCGGVGCSDRGNGQDSCCTKNISDNGETCSVTGAAPCIVDGDVVVDPTPAPVDEPTTGFGCSGDAGIQQEDICCEASCGTCGGVGCSGRGNGQDSCCTKNISDNGETCSVKGAAPCIVDDGIVTPGYLEVGCFIDKRDPERIMAHVTESIAMTIEVCQAHCAGSAYFGVQYAFECWCSGTDSVNHPYAIHGESTDCNEPCAGDASETCGGYFAMNVYQNI